MTEHKHTPGRWEFVRGKIVAPTAANGTTVADVSLAYKDSVEFEANGHLLAAAPALLEALEKSAEGWANAIELGLIPEQHITAATILRDEARAAIAAATEPQP